MKIKHIDVSNLSPKGTEIVLEAVRTNKPLNDVCREMEKSNRFTVRQIAEICAAITCARIF
jgi:hypothetical protein